MLVADDDVRDHANLEEAAKRAATWREAGYYIISMKNDFKTIYGDGVVKTDFTFPVLSNKLNDYKYEEKCCHSHMQTTDTQHDKCDTYF